MAKRTFKDFTGNRYGKLVVIGKSNVKDGDKSRRGYLWKCLCDCGKTKLATAQRIQYYRSCGCSQYENHKKPKLADPRQAHINSIFYSYKHSAKIRNLPFELTYDDYYDLTQQICHYCGNPPSNVAKEKGQDSSRHFIYNGIDRIDSKEGYSMSNCVPCCRTCNIAKSDMGYFEFLNWINKVLDHRTKYYKDILGA